MAEIPVEKKSGFPWLWALLGLLAVGALLWFLASLGDDDAAVANYDADRATAVAGAVDMDGLRVTELTGDMSFYATDNSGKRYFIVFDETRTPNTPTEGQYDINVGNRLDIEGTMRDRNYTLPRTVDATIPAGEKMFIFATDIDMAKN